MVRHAGWPAVIVAGLCVASTASALPDGFITQTLLNVSGARSGDALTTMVTCTNIGSISGQIGMSAMSYDSTVADCSVFATNVPPSQTVTFAIDPVASMTNVQTCAPAATVIDQGRLTVFTGTAGTQRWACTAQLIDKAGDPPTALARLTLYTAGGAPLDDVIFADGFDD